MDVVNEKYNLFVVLYLKQNGGCSWSTPKFRKIAGTRIKGFIQ